MAIFDAILVYWTLRIGCLVWSPGRLEARDIPQLIYGWDRWEPNLRPPQDDKLNEFLCITVFTKQSLQRDHVIDFGSILHTAGIPDKTWIELNVYFRYWIYSSVPLVKFAITLDSQFTKTEQTKLRNENTKWSDFQTTVPAEDCAPVNRSRSCYNASLILSAENTDGIDGLHYLVAIRDLRFKIQTSK